MSFAGLLLLIKNIFHGFTAVAVLIPILFTMGADDKPGTEVVINENATNAYINEYGNPDISAHRSGAGVVPQNTMMAFEYMMKNSKKFGVDTFELIYATGHAVTSTYVSPTCTEEGYDLYTCENCDYEYKEPIEPATSHKYEWSLIREKSCTEDKVIFGKCMNCGDITINNEPASGHTDNNGDGICDVCVKEDVPFVPVCSHSCHSGGFFWKISVFFFKLFGINKYCECGVAHY